MRDSGKTRPRFSVLIVNHNGLAHADECLRALERQSWRDFEVIVTDNASSDGSADHIALRYPWARVVRASENLGFAGGNNLAYARSRGDWIVFLNLDTRADDDLLLEIDRAIREHPATSVFACFLLRHEDPSRVDSAGDEIYAVGPTYCHRDFPAGDPFFRKPREVTSACGAACVYSRRLLERIGLFDEDLFLDFEDVDLSLRARNAGETILFLPRARVLHKGSAIIGRGSYTALYHCSRNLFLVKLKNYPWWILVKYFVPSLVLGLWGLRLYLRHRQMKAFLRGRWDQLLRIPAMLRKRREARRGATLSAREFDRLLRKGWLRDRLRARLFGRESPAERPVKSSSEYCRSR